MKASDLNFILNDVFLNEDLHNAIKEEVLAYDNLMKKKVQVFH